MLAAAREKDPKFRSWPAKDFFFLKYPSVSQLISIAQSSSILKLKPMVIRDVEAISSQTLGHQSVWKLNFWLLRVLFW